jgi:tetratricopeptide (TPR) repeat protein
MFTHTLALNPNSLIAHRQMGLFLIATGRTPADAEAALAHYRAALAIRPADAEIMSNIGTVLLRLARPAAAVDYLQQAAALRPNAVTIHYNLALALSAANRPAQAAEEFRQVLRLSPDFADTNRRLTQATAATDPL